MSNQPKLNGSNGGAGSNSNFLPTLCKKTAIQANGTNVNVENDSSYSVGFPEFLQSLKRGFSKKSAKAHASRLMSTNVTLQDYILRLLEKQERPAPAARLLQNVAVSKKVIKLLDKQNKRAERSADEIYERAA